MKTKFNNDNDNDELCNNDNRLNEEKISIMIMTVM